MNLFYEQHDTEGVARRCFVRTGVLRNFAKFTGKHLRQRLFFHKVAFLSPATLFKKRLWHRCFPTSFAKLLRTPFLQNTSGLLTIDLISNFSRSQNLLSFLLINYQLFKFFRIQMIFYGHVGSDLTKYI